MDSDASQREGGSPPAKSLVLFGATGNLGRHVAAQALRDGWQLAVAVRDRRRLAPSVAASARVAELDLATAPLAAIAAFAAGHDALVCCAGVVTGGEAFVGLVDRVVSALEALAPAACPVCWFLAGAAVLPLDRRGRLGVDLPKVRDTYWPHRRNLERLQRSRIDWRLLCPGPMVEEPVLGPDRLRVAIDALPAPLPAFAGALAAPLVLPLFALAIPRMIVSYADAAAVMLARTRRDDACARRRVGLALPVGMKGRKREWVAQPRGGSGAA